jgi:signal transduction histidine kinase
MLYEQQTDRALRLLLLARWLALAIAAAIVIGRLTSDTSATREPALVIAAFAQCLIVTYVLTGGRDSVASLQRRARHIDVFFVIGLIDMVAALALVFLSDGRGSPYYLFAVSALLVPAATLGLRSVILLAGLFIAGYLLVLWTGTDGAHRPYETGQEASFATFLALPLPIALLVHLLSSRSRTLAERETEARNLLDENVRLQHEREELAAREERVRIAREIHDGISQSMYMLTLNLEAAADTTEPGSDLRGRLQNLVKLAKQVLLEVREYIFELRPLLDREESLGAALRRQAKEFSTVAGFDVTVDISGNDNALPQSHRATLYRIAQEALSNVYRHANATSATVHLACEPNAVELDISDNGAGIEPSTIRGRGLDHMVERASELGGEVTFEVGSGGRGTRVHAMLPTNGHGPDPAPHR